MTKLIFIAFGGALGAPLRYLINDLMKNSYFFMMPSGIMLVNFIGCFCIGIAMAQISDLKSNVYFFLIIGFLGSFTTMSAFSQQTIELLYNGKDLNALIYVFASIASCLIGTFLAYYLFKTT
jgi:CrcB protein|tara:strand:- start:34 stop:399 length:366 start_codon:yes stop_codon:yes gene_type:complete